MKPLFIAVLAALTLAMVLDGSGAPIIGGMAQQNSIIPRLAGSVLVSELSCTACHTSERRELAPKLGPVLSSVGARVTVGHLRKFITQPPATKPGTTMPDVLGHLPAKERDEVANALADYLASLGGEPPVMTKPSADAIKRGRNLFHSIGCVACHSPEKSLPGSVPLGPVEEKYTVASLTKFLEDPLAVRPNGRMPDLKLDHFEAQDIASYLLRNQTPASVSLEKQPEDVARGEALFGQYHCNSCHTVKGAHAKPALASLDKLRPNQGCLSEQPGPWPQFSLNNSQRTAIRSAIAARAAPLTVTEEVELTITRLNCVACHQRGGLGGITTDRNVYFTGRDENLADQGRLPPSLTGVGAKLKPDWLREVLVQGASVRPYVNTRMPKFGAPNVEALVGLFKQVDTLPPVTIPSGTKGAKEAKPQDLGRELAGAAAFNCVACHTFREKSAAAIRAVDLMSMAERLEENWFHHYLASPQNFSPLTIMPNFWPDGKSPLPEVLGGDPGRQRDALWQFLAQGPEAREPQGLVLEPLVLEVKDEAVMLRRAYPGIGKRGIGVGYPAGINLSLDAGQMRLGSIWTGAFIEASALWRGQGSGLARILGKDTVNFPPGVAFAVLDTPTTGWPTNLARQAEGLSFKGYSLDSKQRPTFRYEAAGTLVEDTFTDLRNGTSKPYFIRSLEFPKNPPPAGLHFRVAADKLIERHGDREFTVGKDLRVLTSTPAQVRDADGVKELLLPVKGPFTLEYHLLSTP